jgi:hypothetical protein
MKDTYKSIYTNFSEGTQNTFYLNIISIVLIFFFILGPIEINNMTKILIKIIIISILLYSFYTTINSSNSLLTIEDMFIDPNLSGIMINYLLNLVLCLSMGLLILYIIYDIFN